LKILMNGQGRTGGNRVPTPSTAEDDHRACTRQYSETLAHHTPHVTLDPVVQQKSFNCVSY
jgi:hypothetical protein